MIVQNIEDAKKFATFDEASNVVKALFKSGCVRNGQDLVVCGSNQKGHHIAVTDEDDFGLRIIIGRLA